MSKKIMFCGVCGQSQTIDVERVTEILREFYDRPVDINEFDVVCHNCAHSKRYREKYNANITIRHFILGPTHQVNK